MTNENTVEAYVLYPEGGMVICARKRMLNGVENVQRFRARVQGYVFPAIRTKVTLIKDTLTGGWVVS
jgi:hypothetical protein